MVKQIVTRTRPRDKGYRHEPGAYLNLLDFLNSGYRVVLCTPIGEELEYILEIEIKSGGKNEN